MSKLGCIKDKLDDRDYLMRAYLPVVKLPKKIDYTPKLSPVRDQGDEGTCVSFACATGMKEYVEVFEGMMKTKTGIVPMPKKNETALGGHAICPIGYDDTKKVIKFKNSWSDEWGERGYGFLPYAYVERYMMDAWSSVDIDDPNPLTLESVLKYKEKAIV